MATHTPTLIAIAIPRTVSTPTDANAPSLLTTLPPELRNRIYEILFKRDEPVMVHDIETYQEENFTARMQRIADGNLRPKRAKACDEFLGLTGLLCTCRQVYHEAAGILYGSNDFRLRFNVGTRKCSHFQSLQFPAAWLSRIGTQLQLVSKITIEIQNYMGEHCTFFAGQNMVDLVPILRILWADPVASGKIKFVSIRSSSDMQAQYSMFPSRSLLKPSVDRPGLAEVLNNLLISLGPNDALDLKRYSRFERLVQFLYVKYSNVIQETCIIFQERLHTTRIYNSRDQVSRHFSMLNNGKNLLWENPPGTRSTFLGLPQVMLRRICLEASAVEPEVVIDLESRRTHGMSFNLLHICKAIRNRYRDPYNRSPEALTFIANVNADDITAQSYEAAAEWSNNTILRVTALDSTQIVFRHAKVLHRNSDESFVNTEDLIRLLSRLYANERTTILCKTSSDNMITQSKGRKLSVTMLRCAMFVMLCRLLAESPEKATEAPPKVLINGNFNRLRMVYAASQEAPGLQFDYQLTEESVQELRDRGDVEIGTLDHITSKAEKRENHPHHNLTLLFKIDSTPNTLIGMWKELNDQRWSEWDSESDDE